MPKTTNEMQAVVDEVWRKQDTVAQARKDLQEALNANHERFNDEYRTINDARSALDKAYSKASDELYDRENTAREAQGVADKAARETFREHVGYGYSERAYGR